jgi:Flp pilus assembly protein TadB
MLIDSIKGNLEQMKKLARELYVFTNQLELIKRLEKEGSVMIDVKEKNLLEKSIMSLTKQLKIINNSLPELIENIGFYPKLGGSSKSRTVEKKSNLIKVNYKPSKVVEGVSVSINEKDRKKFLENLSRSHLTIKKLKDNYAIEAPEIPFGKASQYAKVSNHYFRKISFKLISKGRFKILNDNLRKMNSPFVLGTYVSMIFFTVSLSFIFSLFLYLFLLFFQFSFSATFFFVIALEPAYLRALTQLWILLAIPTLTALAMYFYPKGEADSLGSRIDQELPFVTIHMSAVATSGIEPLSIFRIILKSKEYKHTNLEIRKLMNLVNFHGQDIISALKNLEKSSPSEKLKELLGGMATTMTSGGNLHEFLDKHAQTLLFDYKLEREKYTKSSETLMDIYISIAIAAPMILLMLFVIMGSTGFLSNLFNISVNTMGLLIVAILAFVNVGFLVFLYLKQPEM